MIDELQWEGWTEFLEGTLCHMTQRISNKRQEYILEQGDDIVPKVKAILVDSFHKAAAYTVFELVHGNQYIVTQRKGNMLNITMNAQGQNIESGKVEVNKSEVGNEMQSRAKTNILTVADKCCSFGKWQEYKFPCMHACNGYLCK